MTNIAQHLQIRRRGAKISMLRPVCGLALLLLLIACGRKQEGSTVTLNNGNSNSSGTSAVVIDAAPSSSGIAPSTTAGTARPSFAPLSAARVNYLVLARSSSTCIASDTRMDVT